MFGTDVRGRTHGEPIALIDRESKGLTLSVERKAPPPMDGGVEWMYESKDIIAYLEQRFPTD